MRLIALDTATARCAVAVFVDGQVVADADQPMAKGQADALLPLAQAVLARAGLRWQDLDRLAVGIGPGNFTGTRIAVSAVRGLALALDIPAIGISSFEAFAHGHDGPLLVSIDARQGRTYLQGFGTAAIGPMMMPLDAPTLPPLPPETNVIGFEAAALSQHLGLAGGQEQTAPPIGAFARVAAARTAPFTAPAPQYLRAPDAALPADPPPVILDDA